MVDIFNQHREDNFIPGEWICADESISRWYGLGGYWINIGLPMYVAIDRKPENGCEIQNSACGKSGVMLRLQIVKHIETEDQHIVDGPDALPHGTSVLKYLVLPWAQTNRGVCADSYFASVTTAQTLMGLGLRFIGVVKTATKKFPMKYLSSLELTEGRGQREAVMMKSLDVPWIMALVWVDRDRCYFISTASSLKEGKEYSRHRWRQPDQDLEHMDAPNNQDAVRQQLTVPQPEVCEIYYDTCAAIDQHNRHRQDTLQIERKMQTKSWDKRVTTSIFGMYVVDAWLMYKGCTTASADASPKLSQQEFYCQLAEELIDNNQDKVRTRSRRRVNSSQNLVSMSSVPVLRATKKRKTGTGGKLTKFCAQGRCRVCIKARPTTVCSTCEDEMGKTLYFCDERSGRNCFQIHVQTCHM